MSKPFDTIMKKITFWKLGFVVNAKIVNPETLINEVCCLPYTETGRLFQREDNTGIAIWRLNSQEPHYFRFGTQRTNEIPDEVDHLTGTIGPLPIGQNKSILESAFFVLFRDGVIGFSTGMYAPRATQLREYFLKVLKNDVEDVLLEPLAREDIDRLTEEIARSWIKRMTIRYYNQAPNALKSYDMSMAEALEKITALDPECIENTVSWGNGRTSLKNSLLRKFIGHLAPIVKDDDVRVHLIDINISYYNPDTKLTQSVNLLERFIMAKKVVMKIQGKRNIDSNDMKRCILDAYAESIEDIEKANTMVVHAWLKI